MTRLREQIQNASLETAWKEGRDMTVEAAVELAMEVAAGQMRA